MPDEYLVYNAAADAMYGRSPNRRIFKLASAVFAAAVAQGEDEPEPDRCYRCSFWLDHLLEAADYFRLLAQGEQPAGYYLPNQAVATLLYAALQRHEAAGRNDRVEVVIQIAQAHSTTYVGAGGGPPNGELLEQFVLQPQQQIAQIRRVGLRPAQWAAIWPSLYYAEKIC